MQGLHLTADLHQCACDAHWLVDAAALGVRCAEAVSRHGLQSVAQLFHTFPDTAHGPGGVTATVLLAESHLCVHTWPEQRAVTLDVYVCNFDSDQSLKAKGLMAELIEIFQPGRVDFHQLQRGAIAPCLRFGDNEAHSALFNRPQDANDPLRKSHEPES